MPISNWQPFSATDFRVVTRVPTQPDVDELIDRLRAAGISIVGLYAAAREPGRRVLGNCGRGGGVVICHWSLVISHSMRPYLAIIKDSFREALASRVLWVLTGLIGVVLVGDCTRLATS